MGNLKTPLHGRCLEAGAKIVEFAGWDMPIQFDGVLQEHKAVRERCGLFDISHMGVLSLSGKQAKEALQGLVPTDLFRIGEGQACYSVLTNEQGGIIDDLIVYDNGWNKDIHKEELFVVINAARAKKDAEWIENGVKAFEINITDKKGDGVLLALQGPEAEDRLKEITGLDLHEMPPFGHRTFNTQDFGEVLISRTGYTGENGFELLFNAEAGGLFWDQCYEREIQLCGLGARDTLRLEAAMHLYGNDMTEETTPFEVGLGWLVHLEIPRDFIGRKQLEQQAESNTSRKLRCIRMEEKAIPRKGYKIQDANGEVVGMITSGGWSPTLEAGIGLALVNLSSSKLGTKLSVEIRGKKNACKIVKRPFIKKK